MGKADPLYYEIPDHRLRFVHYVGEGFLLGVACGTATAWHFIRGLRSSPAAGGRLARVDAPRIAGFFGVYSALYSALKSAMAVARQRDDPWNSVAACAASLGLLTMRSGGRAAAGNALYGAAIGVVFEGADWVADEWDTRFASQPPPPTWANTGVLAPAVAPPNSADPPGSSGGALSSWLRSSTASSTSSHQSSTSEKDVQVLEDLSRKLVFEKMREGFHSPALQYVNPWNPSFCWRR